MMAYYLEKFHAIHKLHSETREKWDSAKSQILELISELENSKFFLGGGVVASYSLHLFLDNPEEMENTLNLALRLFEKASQNSADPLISALAHIERSKAYKSYWFPDVSQKIELNAKYVYHRRLAAEIFSKHFKNSPKKESYLISGFYILTNFADQWNPYFVEYEIEEGGFYHSNREAKILTPSAFQLLISISEYDGALEVAELAPDGFRYPGVCGWKEVCQGVINKEEADKYYQRAADYFASDTIPKDENSKKKPYWSSYNSRTLAPYFRARAALSKPSSSSDEIVNALRTVSREIQPNASVIVHVPARKLAILIHGLGSFLETRDESELDQIIQNYQKEMRLWGQYGEDDKILLEGLKLVLEAIEGFRYDPVTEIMTGRLSKGMRILESVPEWSQLQFISNLGNTFGASALEISQGMTYEEVGSILRTITDEKILQQLILLLLKSKGPHHSKVTHGPIEYGKDVIAIIDDCGTPRLHLYVVKAGDIDASKWPSAKEAIDQAFTVSNNNPLVTQYKPASVHGFLAFNGHFNQHIDPTADSWLNYLRTERKWDVKVIDSDGLSKWIVSYRLVSTLKRFMKQQSKQ